MEWLAHHRACGFGHFYVYTNNNTDGSGELLRTLASFGVIHLIENDVGPGVKIQSKILEHSLHLLPELRDFEWVFYIDVDEFFMSRCQPELTLDSFLRDFQNAFPVDSPSAICLHWKWFGSENAFEMTDGLLLERFIYSIHNEHVKSLVRLKDVISMHRVHVPVLIEGARLVNADFQEVEPATTMKPAYGKAQLNHYWNKSFQEFMLKRARGRISAGLDGAALDFSVFFDWGINSRRGDLDPPPQISLERTKVEYGYLLSIAGVEEVLDSVRLNGKKALTALDGEINMNGGVQETRADGLDASL